MKRFVVVAALVIGVFAVGAVTPAEQPAKTADAVKAVLTDQVACWNKADLDGFLKTYWNDDKLTFYSGGTISNGWKAVAERYRKNYQADGKEMGQLTFSNIEVEILGPEAAMARAKWELKLSKETVGGLFTLILRKFPDGWKIVHDHTSKADPPKKPE